MINNKLSKLSSNKNILNSIKKDYNEALTSSRHRHNKLKGYDKNNSNSNRKVNRPRKIRYFNHPFCFSVKTNKGKRFLDRVSLHFPNKKEIHTIFTRNRSKSRIAVT